MATWKQDGPILRIETDNYRAAVRTEGYTSGVMAGSFVDKRTGAHDPGFGLVILDFLMEPGTDDDATPKELRYHTGDLYHGNIRKRYVELPQICTQAKKLPFEVVEGKGFVAVKQWFTWSVARPPYKPGSRWEQWLVFPDGARWFFAYDKITSVNTVDGLFVRMDMPGHIKHQRGDTFKQVYLSYQGGGGGFASPGHSAERNAPPRCLPAEAFFEDFPPEARNLYRRQEGKVPQRFIRACQLSNGTWLAGMSLNPAMVYEAWCHQRGYICMIQEIGGFAVRAEESFGSVHLVGYFNDIADMERAFAAHKGANYIHIEKDKWRLVG